MSDTSNREDLELNKDVATVATNTGGNIAENMFRARLPQQTTIISETFFTPSTSSGENVHAAVHAAADSKSFRIVRTTELDSYEDEMPIEDLVALRFSLLRAEAPVGDNFRGSARKAAKLSIADSETEEFADVADLIATLPKHNVMVNRRPKITTARDSNRVKEEKRNVRVRTFLYAASRENDNDFHLIIGRDPNADSEMYMNVEISGLPASNSPFISILRAARDSYKNYFGNDLPGFSYDFYNPPIPVEIEGSLFFDMSHATGSRPGPSSLRANIPEVWEIHPITKIIFEP